jgi:hypothetical protein
VLVLVDGEVVDLDLEVCHMDQFVVGEVPEVVISSLDVDTGHVNHIPFPHRVDILPEVYEVNSFGIVLQSTERTKIFRYLIYLLSFCQFDLLLVKLNCDVPQRKGRVVGTMFLEENV